jgi:hypothetical protein
MSEESTTPDLVGLMQRLAKAASERDFGTSDSYYAPDAVWDSSRTGVGTFAGMEAITRFFEDWRGGFEEWEMSFEKLLDLGNGVVFTLVHQAGRPVGATGFVRQLEPWVWVWTDGLIERVIAYPDADVDEARATAERLAEERG